MFRRKRIFSDVSRVRPAVHVAVRTDRGGCRGAQNQTRGDRDQHAHRHELGTHVSANQSFEKENVNFSTEIIDLT